MRALVTGATGFVGAAVARALLHEGWEVRALARKGSDRRNLRSIAVEVVEGDLVDAGSLAAAVTGCDGLFHVAADYRLGAFDPRQLYATNVEGTRNILNAARDAGVRRVVYTSSVATIGIPTDGSPGTEQSPSTLSDMVGHYKRSKYQAEEVAREAARAGIAVVIVNPSTPVGPGDVKPTPTGQMVFDAAAGRMPAYVDTGLNIVHVDDVANGHLLAYHRGRVGERYILGGQDMTLRDILVEIAGLVGRKPPSVRLPSGVVMPIAYVAEAVARLTGRSTRITVEGVRTQAFADAIAWFRDQGLLRG
jgi:dihydroflavonol-4-reductase